MLPSRRQYDKWSLPSKWAFCSAIIGIPLSALSLVLSLLQQNIIDDEKIQRVRSILQVTHELHYNDEWLSNTAIAYKENRLALPSGELKTNALMKFMEHEYDHIIMSAYGEEKHVYQLALLLHDLGSSLRSPKSAEDINKFNMRSEQTLHDVLFLNNFLLWYIQPIILDAFEDRNLHSLIWGLPKIKSKVKGITVFGMRHFIDDGEPITDYVDYLGAID